MLSLFALKLLILAGGATPEENHHSHLIHVKGLSAFMESQGLPLEDQVIFWADGEAKAPDRARRPKESEEEWLLQGTLLDRVSDPGLELLNTRPFGQRLYPASREALRAWFQREGAQMKPGDMLLFAVTDHGEPDPEGRSNTRINLWGEILRVEDLREDLKLIPEGVKVLLWMSQCFSGGFAHLEREGLCGVFSASADRPAYGCFPDQEQKPEIGHFMQMLEALKGGARSLMSASDQVMLRDDTPDSPHLSSDAFLWRSLHNLAKQRGAPLDRLIDAGLSQASLKAPEWRLISQISSRYGLGSISRYSQLLSLMDELAATRYPLRAWGEAWERGLVQSLNRLARPLYQSFSAPKGFSRKRRARARLRRKMLRALKKRPMLNKHLQLMRARRDEAGALSMRLNLQEAAALRLARLLSRVAGPQLLDPLQLERLEALRSCEQSPFLPPPALELESLEPALVQKRPLPQALPPFTQLWGAVEALRPGYFGLAYRDLPKFQGAEVTQIIPGGPGAAAELQVGDLILAVGERRLDEEGAFFESALFSESGKSLRLEVQRGEERLILNLVPHPRPLPSALPYTGEHVPDLRIQGLDGLLPILGSGQPSILYFWATWCVPCQKALPVLQIFAKERGAQIIAITSEPKARVRAFLQDYGVFPVPIALDLEREATRLFSVEKLPSFVHIDSTGRLVQIGEGFKEHIPLK